MPPPPSSPDTLDSIPLTREEIQEGYDTSLLSLPERHSTSTHSYSSLLIPPINETIGTRSAAVTYEKRAREVESRRRLLVGEGEGDEKKREMGDGNRSRTKRRRKNLIFAMIGLGVFTVLGVGLGAGLGLGLFGRDEGEGKGESGWKVVQPEVSSVGETEGTTSVESATTLSEMGAELSPSSSGEPIPIETTQWWSPESEVGTATTGWDEVVPAQATAIGGVGDVVGGVEGTEEGASSTDEGR
ncbi:hypothetical protein JCM5353_006946 [Sporobolomyces roseus]